VLPIPSPTTQCMCAHMNAHTHTHTHTNQCVKMNLKNFMRERKNKTGTNDYKNKHLLIDQFCILSKQAYDIGMFQGTFLTLNYTYKTDINSLKTADLV